MLYFTLCYILLHIVLHVIFSSNCILLHVIFYSMLYFTLCYILLCAIFCSILYFTLCYILHHIVFYSMLYFTPCYILMYNFFPIDNEQLKNKVSEQNKSIHRVCTTRVRNLKTYYLDIVTLKLTLYNCRLESHQRFLEFT